LCVGLKNWRRLMRPILLWIVTLLPLMSPVGALAQDNGDGMYTNPPLYADYPDADIIRGLRARGGYVVDVAWKDGKLARAVLHSELGNPCEIGFGDKLEKMTIPAGQDVVLGPDLQRVPR
jgi:hypothetical protein